jgi:hypothetical protein
MDEQPVLECQMCGQVLRTLTPAEAQEVAHRPYDFILNCLSCVEWMRMHGEHWDS